MRVGNGASGPSRIPVFSLPDLGFLAGRPDNSRHVRLAFLFFLEEGVVLAGGRNLRRIVAEIDDLLVLLDRNVGAGLLDLLEADDVCGLYYRRFDLRLDDLAWFRCGALAAPRRGWRHLIYGLACGTGDRRAVQVVKPRPTV